MVETLETFSYDALGPFDEIIDVRSPGEFAEDHIPGAINLPVLSDVERAEIGTIYVQDSKFKAKRLGAAQVSRNIALHLETALAEKAGSYAPLIYCWRGGQRSNAMATILSQVGWRTRVLKGGYKTYRQHVTARLYDAEPDFRVILLDGNTGTAKTELLGRLAGKGVQVIDLEGMAAHRGSIFGGFADEAQPSQRMFESRLLHTLSAFDVTKPILCEAESSKIGKCVVPPTLWKAMQAAPRIELSATPETRAKYLVTAYSDIIADHDRLNAMLDGLVKLRGKETVATWKTFVEAGQYQALAEALIEQHYDPAYGRSRGRKDWQSLGIVELRALDDDGQGAAVDELISRIETNL